MADATQTRNAEWSIVCGFFILCHHVSFVGHCLLFILCLDLRGHGRQSGLVVHTFARVSLYGSEKFIVRGLLFILYVDPRGRGRHAKLFGHTDSVAHTGA